MTLSTLSSYSDACWDSQIGSAVADGILLPLFKLNSMSSGTDFRNGGPLGWFGEHQDVTLLSFCKAEICITNAISKKVVAYLESSSKYHCGWSFPFQCWVLYNDNNDCIKWSHNMTSMGLTSHWTQRKLCLWMVSEQNHFRQAYCRQI